MDFKNLKTDPLATMADLVRREAAERDPAMGAALRGIEIVQDGHYGVGRPDVRLTVALAAGLEAIVESSCSVGDASAAMLAEYAGELVEGAERVFEDRNNTIEMLREVRATLSREVAKGRRRGLPYRTLAVALTPSKAASDELPAVAIAIDVVGPMLETSRMDLIVESAEEVVEAFAELREQQHRRLALRDELARTGADFMIDAVTLAALEDARVEPATAVAGLRASDIGSVDIEVRHGRLVLRARDGVVSGNVPLAPGMHWLDGRLTVANANGFSVADFVGKSPKAVLQHDFFSEDDKVHSGVGFDKWLLLRMRPRAVPLRLPWTCGVV